MGVPAGSAWTAESDQYTCQAQFLRALGCQLAQAPGPEVFLQIPATPGPRILVHPTSAIFLSELKSIVPTPGNVTISANSTLIVKGDVVIERLDLDGALTLIAAPGTRLIVNAYGDEGRVANAGHKFAALPTKAENDEDEYSEVARMRGFVIQKQDEKVINTENDLAQLGEETKVYTAANGSSVEVFYFSGGKVIQEKYYEAQSAPSVCKSIFSFC